jgi:hypothetical protein
LSQRQPMITAAGDSTFEARSGVGAVPAVLRRLTEQLSLQGEDVIEDAIDAPALEAVLGDHAGTLEMAAQ